MRRNTISRRYGPSAYERSPLQPRLEFNVELPTTHAIWTHLIAPFSCCSQASFINLTTRRATKEPGDRHPQTLEVRAVSCHPVPERDLPHHAGGYTAFDCIDPLLLKPSPILFRRVFISHWPNPSSPFSLSADLLVSLLAGIYPALVLSSYQVMWVLKNQAMPGCQDSRVWPPGAHRLSVRHRAVLYYGRPAGEQTDQYMLDKDSGFNKEAILSVQLPYRDTSISPASLSARPG